MNLNILKKNNSICCFVGLILSKKYTVFKRFSKKNISMTRFGSNWTLFFFEGVLLAYGYKKQIGWFFILLNSFFFRGKMFFFSMRFFLKASNIIFLRCFLI